MNIKQELNNLKEEKYQEFHANLCPGTTNILGVRVPILRNYAKQLNSKYSLDFLFNNIDDEYYEEIMLKGMLIGLNQNLEWKQLEEYIKKFVPKINNWAICDTFCTGLKITNKYKNEIFSLIKEYLDSKNEFEVRFAIVMILDYYINSENLQEIFKIFDNLVTDKYYIKMAIAWAISICLIKYHNETYLYLKNNNKLDNWTYNKAIQKAIESYRIKSTDKDKLRKLKRNIK